MSLIVPAYNEEERLPAMLDDMLRYLKQRQADQMCVPACARGTAWFGAVLTVMLSGQDVYMGDYRGG